MHHRFVSIEGIEGAGKTTAMRAISDWVSARGGEVVQTREPGGTALGEELRSVLLSHRGDGMSALTEVLLMFAARAEHIERVIQPALDAGQWVISDRFTDASIAYQGAGRGLGMARVEALAQWLNARVQPDLTLWLDVPVATGLARAAGRSTPDRFEAEQGAFLKRCARAMSGSPSAIRSVLCALMQAPSLNR
jgi:thymidylate kinase (EC 2.7.4.9)